MALVYGLISPHPPIILPEVGGAELERVRGTIEALEAAVGELARARPEVLIIISPHEGHGFEVPEYYLRRALPGEVEIEEILVTEASYRYYFDYGKDVGEKIRQETKRYGIVASGDLSHVLKEEGPYGFHPSGPVLDGLIMKAVRERDAKALLEIDPKVLEDGAECGLRSILFLLGAFWGMRARMDAMSYEGPFGVGYMVATLVPEGDLSLTDLARDAVRYGLKSGALMNVPEHLPPDWKRRAGVFVSLHEQGELRGCIGTIAPTKDNLAEEVIANAVAAATQDPRFEPVRVDEVEALEISVDVLGEAVREKDVSKLDPKRYGVIVAAKDGRQGVLLPDLQGVDTLEEQIRICREKGGIGADEAVEVYKFEVERYGVG